MSERNIPEYVDPFHFAEQSISLDGILNIKDMHRLCAIIGTQEGKVKSSLEFGVDRQGITFLKGQVETILSLQCQRCLEVFDYEIKSDFVLGIVKTLEEANELPEHYEPALTKNGELALKLALREVIEDELILNLPIIPKHEPDQCKIKLPLVDSGWKEERTKNPFQVLESLKHKQH